MPLRFLFDEHMPPAYASLLIHEAPALAIRDIGSPGTPPRCTLDPALLIWCVEHDFLLLTNNRKSMPVHLNDHLAAGRQVPGILTVDRSRGVVIGIDALMVTTGASFPREYQDRIASLPLT